MRLSTRRTPSTWHAASGLLLATLALAGCKESPLAPPGDTEGNVPLLSAAAATPDVNTTFNNLAGLSVSGTATARCVTQGTQITVNLSGLRAKGVYTVWLFTYVPPGFNPSNPAENRDGVGSLGANDGSQNSFRASTSGQGQLSVIMLAGDLSVLGTAGDCLQEDEYEYHFVVFFHSDGMTNGPVPGTGFPEGGFIFN